MQLTWKVLFSDSSRDHGTLSQLFSLIKRLPAAKKPKEDMHACTDALFTVLKGYIVAAACRKLKIDITRNEKMELQAEARVYCTAIYENCRKIYPGW